MKIIRMALPYDPALCPECGETIILDGISTAPDALRFVPAHPDMVTPYVDCAASAQAIVDGRIVLDEGQPDAGDDQHPA